MFGADAHRHAPGRAWRARRYGPVDPTSRCASTASTPASTGRTGLHRWRTSPSPESTSPDSSPGSSPSPRPDNPTAWRRARSSSSGGVASACLPGISSPAWTATPAWPSGPNAAWPATWRRATGARTGAVTVRSPWCTTDAPGLVGEDAVVADVAQLVDMGARHITFGDPDFLNGPHHAARVIDAVHGAFPDVTFDVTVKVEHILRHRDLWPRMGAAGCLFAVSAFESASDEILGQLDKGHSAAEEAQAVGVLRARGDRAPAVAPPLHAVDAPRRRVRALGPRGALRSRGQRRSGAVRHPAARSPRLAAGQLRAARGTTRRLRRRAPRVVVARARPPPRHAAAGALGPGRARRRRAVAGPSLLRCGARAAAVAVLGSSATQTAEAPPADMQLRSPIPLDQRPRLTEAWFCCAEPNGAQMATAGALDGPAAPAAVGGK